MLMVNGVASLVVIFGASTPVSAGVVVGGVSTLVAGLAGTVGGFCWMAEV